MCLTATVSINDHSMTRQFCLISVLVVALTCKGDASETQTTADPEKADLTQFEKPSKLELAAEPTRNWGIFAGVALISQNTIDEELTGNVARADGDAGGELYSITLNWVAHRFALPLHEHVFTPQLEPYLTLTLVDEHSGSPFLDYNGGAGIRWVNFPWNRWITTTVFTGIGLSYSSRVYTVDRERHPGEERSHLKFDWPIQFTFAVPRWPQHQFVIFNDHQSGGHVFDVGGVNSFGIGYRFEF